MNTSFLSSPQASEHAMASHGEGMPLCNDLFTDQQNITVEDSIVNIYYRDNPLCQIKFKYILIYTKFNTEDLGKIPLQL